MRQCASAVHPSAAETSKRTAKILFLTGKLAASYINMIQAAGIGACIKHFAANDQETRRFFVDEIIPERALREIHLQPFQIAIRDSQPWTVMTA
jgi:beta-glucosidase